MYRPSRREFLRDFAVWSLLAAGSGCLASCQPTGGLAQATGGGRATAPRDWPYAREARHYSSMIAGLDCTSCHADAPSEVLYCHIPHSSQYVKCGLCPRGCVIAEGHRGDCRVRENRGGKLYTLVYGNPCALNNDPIEKKPFYHFWPGTFALSLATAGCNLHCQYCQNWTISQARPEDVEYQELMPEAIVALALKLGSRSIAFTYSEPTVFFEYMVDTARLARSVGLASVVISAGYINPTPLRELCGVVDAIKIDLKGFNEEFYRRIVEGQLQPVLRTLETIAQSGVHLEIVNLVVPTLNDNRDELRRLSEWIVAHLGPDVPTHFSRFHPMYKLINLPSTPVETLDAAREAALQAGIRYVYVGNVPGHPANSTYCHCCGKTVVERVGYAIVGYHIDSEGRCAYCGCAIPGVWDKEGPPKVEGRPGGTADY
jgi:pyruvate formate lyase activating enzyme